jgi:Kef-type K+ transport system membrane component KefB
MSYGTATSLFVIAVAVALAPLCSEVLRRWRVPSVLFELLLGILIGPEVLHWADVNSFVAGLAVLGICFLFFMAGYEIDFSQLTGHPLNRGITGWLVSLLLGLAVGVVLLLSDYVVSSLLVGLSLTTTTIGTLLPMLRDRDMLDSSFGRYLVAAGTAGEFGPVLAVTVLLGASRPGTELALLVLFVLVTLGVAYVATRRQPPRMVETMQRHLDTSSQLPVRIVLLLLTGLVLVAASLSLEVLLGAFAAGLIVRLAFDREQTEAMQPRLESIGFGFLIPVFFVVSGMTFHASALVHSAAVLERVPIFLGLLLVVRGAPALFVYVGILPVRQRAALGVLQATALPLLVVISEIGLATHRMEPVNATALVGAGMLSVLIFPLVGFALAGSGAGQVRDDLVGTTDPARDLL